MKALLKHFHEVVTTEEDVEQLKKLILKLAFRGQLVEQNPNNEPVSQLLQRMEEAKQRLIKEKKIKKEKQLPSITPDEVPFNIPSHWKWVRLGEIGQIVGGGTPKSQVAEYWAEPGQGVPWITPADLGGNKNVTISRGRRDISQLGLQKSSATLMPKGTVLFSSRAPIGYVAIAENEISTNQGFKSVVPYIMEMNKYIYYYLLFLGEELNSKASGTTFNEVSGKYMSMQLFPLPPLEEQKEIVAKIQKLFHLLDTLKEEIRQKEKLFSALNKSVFTKIQDYNNPSQMEDLQFAIENMEHLCNTKEDIDLLRNSILSLAVQGKLVKQNPDDEPASVLLEKIKKEKERLITEKKIKREEPLPPITPDEIPYELPSGWEWKRLGEICILNPRNQIDDDTDVSFIPMKLIEEGFNNAHTYEIKKWKEVKKGFTHFQENDVAIAKITPCFENRKSVVMKGLVNGFGAGTTELHIIRLFPNTILPEYILYVAKTENFISAGVSTYIGTAGQQRISKDFIRRYPIPIPPLNEQKRIVARINELFTLINQFEQQIIQYNHNRQNLTNAILHESLLS